MASHKRLFDIDFLRSSAIIGVIVTHVLSYHLDNPTIAIVWNYLHFVVPLFVFCSGWVLAAKLPVATSVYSIARWYTKRIARLLIPYYAYLVIHYLLWWFFPGLISGVGLVRSIPFVFQSIFLVGGIDRGWLPLLFIELMIIFPLLVWLAQKPFWRFVFLVVSVGSTVLFASKLPIGIDFRWLMWMPWSLLFFVSIMLSQKEAKGQRIMLYYALTGLVGLSVFFMLSMYKQFIHPPYRLIDHKYPPDVYYLSYALGVSSLVIMLSKLPIIYTANLCAAYEYLSAHSYELFFIHYIVADVVLTLARRIDTLQGVGTQLFIVIVGSIAVSLFIDRIHLVFQKTKK